jgi:hypothetical protein
LMKSAAAVDEEASVIQLLMPYCSSS